MEHIRSQFPSAPKKRARLTERGELMRYFKEELNKARHRDKLEAITMPRMGKILEAIPTNDLYYLKSVCDQAQARGQEFSKRFWWEVDPKKHDEAHKAEYERLFKSKYKKR